MKIYNYDGTTGEFLNTTDAIQDPLDDTNFLIPAYATTVAPPKLSGKVAVFNNGSWSLVIDQRGMYYDTTTKQQGYFDLLGSTPPGTITSSAPISSTCIWNNDDKNWEEPALDATAIRLDRTNRLSKCDWTQFSDGPLSSSKKTAWATYRQALRDITKQSGFPGTITWPTEPK